MFRRNPVVPPKNGHKNGNGNGNGHATADGHAHANGGFWEVAAPARMPAGIETVLGANASFNGVLNANAGVRIDGCFDGTIEVDGPLAIGEGARVVAESIRARVVSVAGSVKGNIYADKVEILRSGRIYGDLDVISFITEEGAILRGNVTMRDASDEVEATRPIPVAAAIGRTAG